jgi:cob(I)alamin adenosyltransferase
VRTKFFTGVGDSGESTVGKTKISKSSPLIEFLGGLDELNSWVGFCRAGGEAHREVASALKRIQEILFIAQAEVAAIGFGYEKSPHITKAHTEFLEERIKEIDAELPELKKFVLPGGSALSASLDVARANARRVERLAKRYSEEKPLSPDLLQFLNRLSSMFFALARYANFKLNIPEEHPSYE